MGRWIEWATGSWLISMLPVLTFLWTWMVTFVFFIRGLDTTGVNVSIFNIVYVTFALIFIISFQLSRDLWLRIVIRSWIFVFVHVVFVFLSTLLHQFSAVRRLHEYLGISSKWQKDLGLFVFSMSELIFFLFSELIIIVMLIILRVLLHRVNPVPTIRLKGLEKMIEVLDTFFDVTKLTVFGIIMACISRVTAVNFLILIAAVMSLVLRRIFRFIIIQLISICSAIILLSQMIMQLNCFSPRKNVTCASGNITVTLSLDAWIGIGKLQSEESILHNVIGYFCIIALVTIYTVVIKGENVLQGLRHNSGWSPYKMFNDVVYLEGDKDFQSYVKYLLKYGFYHYGIQFTYVFIGLLIQARLDFWAMVYSIWLVIFVLCSDKTLSAIWNFFKYFLVIVIPLQYAATLGPWPETCFGYNLNEHSVLTNAFQWLSLPIGNSKPDAFSLFWDLIVFLFALCQANVFEFEKKHDSAEVTKMSPSIAAFDPEPVIKRTTTFGLVRYVVFHSLPIISAIGFFLVATISTTIFSIFSGLGFAAILWYSDDYFILSSERTQKLWRYLLIFNVLMIFVKTSLQIPACIFMDYLVNRWCWVVQLFGIACFKTSTHAIIFLKVPVLPTTVGIEWDILCFITLIFHQRFLQSSYYTAMANEAELNLKFSIKAAKILEELNKKDIRDMQEKYLRNLEKIQKNMKRLEEAQKRIRGIKISEPSTHQEAVTSGDYYMFHETDKDTKLCTPIDDEEQREQEELDCPETPNIGKFMETVLKTDIEQALKLTDSSSSGSKRSSHSSTDDIKSEEKCKECDCEKQIQRFNESRRQELRISSEQEIRRDVSSKSDPKIRKEYPTIVLKDDKLQPTFKFSRKKPLESEKKPVADAPRIPSTSNALPSPSNSSAVIRVIKKCSCSCETCKCGLFLRFRVFRKLQLLMKFLQAFGSSCVVSLCQFCNKMARDYKYITKQLEIEKYADKDAYDSPTSSMTSSSTNAEKDKMFTRQLPVLIRLLMCFYDVIISRFNAVCFLSVVLLQMRNPTIFSLPLTMMVLCWGSLSVPRPTKRFWKILISYTSIVLLMECILRSHLMEDNVWFIIENSVQADRLYGIDRTQNYTIYYLNIILAVYWQRSMLKSIGLWNDRESPKPRGNLFRRALESMNSFFDKLLYNTSNRIPVDVYTHIFVCDFVNIFVFIFGFASITEKKEDGVSRYFSENKVPPTLLGIFVVQCLIIFMDRWIYLRRHVVAKLIFQFSQILLVHFFLFLLLPAILLKRSNHMFFPSLWYGIKCLYFLLSAYQIRCGYPASVHGHALCQSYNVINLYLYQIYLLFPFVYELRTVTDWMWTETTLTLSEWLGMEDIFCTVFTLKCWRNYDNKYSYKRGEKITSTVKFTVGGGVVTLFFLILLFPLAFFAFGYVAGKQNMPEDMEFSFRIGSYKPIFTAFTANVQSLSMSEWLEFKERYRHAPRATSFLSEYNVEDVGIIQFPKYSISEWTVSPILEQDLMSALRANQQIKALAEWKLRRKTENPRQSKTATGSHSVTLTKSEINHFLHLIDGTEDNFTIGSLSPKFLKVSGVSNAPPVEVLEVPYEDLFVPAFANITFKVELNGMTTWWQAYEQNYRLASMSMTTAVKQSSDILIYTFNDKIFPPGGIFSYVSAQGILGLYTTFLISLGLIIRRLCRGRTNQVFLDYIPNVDCILQLLLDIYFVREHKDGKLEEDLYAKLIFLFRSPETLIQWTRMPEESD